MRSITEHLNNETLQMISPVVSDVPGARRRTVVYSPGEFLVSVFVSTGLLV